MSRALPHWQAKLLWRLYMLSVICCWLCVMICRTWCRSINDAETNLLAQKAERHNSSEVSQAQFLGRRTSTEGLRTSMDGQRLSVDGSQAGLYGHRISKDGSQGYAVGRTRSHSVEAPSLRHRPSTTLTEGLLPSVTEGEATSVPEQEVPSFFLLFRCIANKHRCIGNKLDFFCMACISSPTKIVEQEDVLSSACCQKFSHCC